MAHHGTRNGFSGFLFLASLSGGLTALPTSAAFVVPTDWTRPTNLADAASNKTTYQEWQRFVSPAGPNVPNDGFTGDSTATGALDGVFYVNPNDTASTADNANVFDTSGVSFVTGGGNIYSFAGVIKPVATFASFGLAGDVTRFVVNVRTLGSELQTVDTTDSGGNVVAALTVNGVSVSTLPSYSYTENFRQVLGGFGGSLVDHAWEFTASDAAIFTLAWNVGSSSVSFDALTIDISTVTVPEPAGMAAVGTLAGVMLVRRRSRMTVSRDRK